MTWADKFKAKKNWIIGSVAVVVLIIIAVVLGVVLSKKKV